MTQSQEEITKVFIEGFIIIVAGWDLIFTKEETWYKRISKAGWLLIILAFSDISISIVKLSTEKEEKTKSINEAKTNHELDKKALENDVEQAFKKHSASFNPVTKTIIIDTEKTKKENPFIFIGKTSISNRRIGKIFDTIYYQIDFCNESNFDALHINVNAIVYIPHNVNAPKKQILNMAKDFAIPKGITYQYSGMELKSSNNLTDTSYLYITGNYNGNKKIDLVLINDGKSNDMPIVGPTMHDSIVKKIKQLK